MVPGGGQLGVDLRKVEGIEGERGRGKRRDKTGME
jgi:hypothetical protein